jgi:hypothetical protein
MTTSTTPLTELEAVNVLLSCIGEAPVNVLDDTGLVDVATARATLGEVSRLVQNRGWNFNCEQKYPLTRNVDGELHLPANTAKVKPSADFSDLKLTQRGTRLYDRENHTFVFTKDITVDLTVLLPFDELPQAARHYITLRAARVFQGRVQGAETNYRFTEDDEAQALVDFSDAESDTGDYNVLSGTWGVAQILDRYS